MNALQMTAQIDSYKKWFLDYVAGFYNGEKINDENIKLKEQHSLNVYNDITVLAEEISLEPEDNFIAQVIGLFHDVGRFEQYRRFKSYNDVGTVNHARLGVEVLAEHKILEPLGSEKKKIIETAVKLHGDKDLSTDGLDEKTIMFAKLIRDADKLDIYNVMDKRLDDIKANPEKYQTTFGMPAGDKYNKKIIETVMQNETIDYAELGSINDMVIAMLGWISNINFTATLKLVRSRGCFKRLISFLPPAEDIKRVAEYVLSEIDRRIAEEKLKNED